MENHFVGRLSEFADPSLRVVTIEGQEIGVARLKDEVRAYANICVHQGGPACSGRLMGKVEAILDDELKVRGERFSESEMHIVCPWHGYEYDLLTGKCAADPKLHLKSFPVSVDGDEVYVRIG